MDGFIFPLKMRLAALAAGRRIAILDVTVIDREGFIRMLIRHRRFRSMHWSIGLLVLLILAAVPLPPQTASAAEAQPIRVFLDTDELTFDTQPVIQYGTTLVPFRPLFEALGMEVGWDAANKQVTGKDSDRTIVLTIGEKQASINGVSQPLTVPAQVMDGRTMVPLRFVGEATGSFVFWDPYAREILIVTPHFLRTYDVTPEELTAAMNDYLEERAAEEARRKAEEEEQRRRDNAPKPEQRDRPAIPVELDKLDGMYYGYRNDFGGYECGGICWDLYTFMPKGKVLIGLPAGGGPETIDCAKDDCLDYTIRDGELRLSNGESLPIEKTPEGFLMINDVTLDSVLPVPDGMLLDGTYTYKGYSGLIGITPAASSWIYSLELRADGMFELDGVSLGSLGIDPNTSVAAGKEAQTGKYEIKGNTIMLTAGDGTEAAALFFLHNTNPEDAVLDIQFGAYNYYLD